MTNTPNVAAGWYPDPAGSGSSRWWDGTKWTDDLQVPYSVSTASDLRASEGTAVYSIWIWLVVLLPYVSLPFIFTIDVSSFVNLNTLSDESAAMQSQLALLTSPSVLLSTVFGWLAQAAAMFCAYRDWRWLQAAGVQRPFHWAWSFLMLAGYPVYAIGRAIVTRRRTGHGSAVLWVAIGMLVLSFVISIAWVLSLTGQIMQDMGPYIGA